MNWGDAVCAQVDGDYWFPEEKSKEPLAALICRDWCPVAGECLAEAFAREEGKPRDGRYGVWGAMTPDERWVFDPSEPVEQRDQRVTWWMENSRRLVNRPVDRARIAWLIGEGMTTREIVLETGVSPRSVRRVQEQMSTPVVAS